MSEDQATDAPKKKEKLPPLAEQNGVSQPREGTTTRSVWDICDSISQANERAALRNEVMAAGEDAGISKGTIATQYSKWMKFHGVTKEQLKTIRDSLKPAEEEESGEEA